MGGRVGQSAYFEKDTVRPGRVVWRHVDEGGHERKGKRVAAGSGGRRTGLMYDRTRAVARARGLGGLMSLMMVCATAGGALRLLDAVCDASVPLSDVLSSACSTASSAHTLPMSVRWPNSRLFIDPHPPRPVSHISLSSSTTPPTTFPTYTAVRDDDDAPLLLYY